MSLHDDDIKPILFYPPTDKEIPTYVIPEGGRVPPLVKDENSFITCQHCGYNGLGERWHYWMDAEEEEAAYGCPECGIAVFYLRVMIWGTPMFNQIKRLTGEM